MKKTFTLVALAASLLAFAQIETYRWGAAFGGPQNDVASSIATAPDGSLYATGTFTGTIDFDPGDGDATLTATGDYANIFILKFNASGGLLWAKKIQHNLQFWSPFCDTDPQGNLYLSGSFTGTADFDPSDGVHSLTATGNGPDGFAMKMDPQGNMLWAKTLGVSTESEYISAVAVDTNGNLNIGGYLWGILANDDQSIDTNMATTGLLARFGSDGTPLLISKSTALNSGANGIYSLDTDEAGFIYITGGFSGGISFPGSGGFGTEGGADTYIAKLNGDGSFIWGKAFGGSNTDSANSIKVDSNGFAYITGQFASPLVNFIDSNGFTQSIACTGASNTFTAKFSATGDIFWMHAFEGSGYNGAFRLALGDMGKIYIAGNFSGTLDFDPSTTAAFPLTATGYDTYIQCLDSDGNFISASKIGNVDSTIARDVATGSDGSVFVTSYFRQALNLNIADDTQPVTVTNVGFDDFFIIRFNGDVMERNEFAHDAISLYPNPCDGSFNLAFPEGMQGRVSIVDMLGHVIMQPSALETSYYVFKSGIYLVVVENEGQKNTHKLIVR